MDILLKFEREKEANGTKLKTIVGYLGLLIQFIEYLKDKNLKETEKDDIIGFLEVLKNRGLKEISINSHKFKLNKFFLWLNGDKKYPKCIEWLKPKRMKYIMLPKDIPTVKEIMALVENASTERDKALVFVGYESATRINEFRSLRICDCEFDDMGCKLTIHHSKTDERVVRIVDSVPYLKRWLNIHPNKSDLTASLWVEAYRTRPKYRGEPLFHTGILKIIKRLAKRSGLDENRFTFQKLRHRRITELVRAGVPERVIKRIVGHKSNSQALEVYYQATQEEEDKVLLDMVYDKGKREKKDRETKPKTCPKCQKENPIEAKFCYNCYNPLDIETTEQLDYLKNIIGQIITESWSKTNPKEALPQIIEKFREKVNEAEP